MDIRNYTDFHARSMHREFSNRKTIVIGKKPFSIVILVSRTHVMMAVLDMWMEK